MSDKYWAIKAEKTGESAEVWIYDVIGEGFWSEGVAAKKFCKELAQLNVKRLDVRINSPGGSVTDGIAIYNALKRHTAQVTTYIDAEAASIASVIALAGKRCVMAENAVYMIHDPWAVVSGSANDLRKEANVLDTFKSILVNAYVEKSGMSEDEVSRLMTEETWMTAEEAMAAGFVDEIAAEAKIAACKFDHKALGYKRVDTSDTTEETTNTAPQAEIEEAVMSEVVAAPVAGASRDFQREAAEIATMCQAYGFGEKTAEFIGSGLTPDQVGRAILDLGKSKPVASDSASVVDMGKEAKNYSYCNAIAAAANMASGKQASGLEVEIHQELLKKQPVNAQSRGGILIPMATSLTSGGTNTGGELLRTQYGDLIEYLRNLSVCTRMGATTLNGLQGPLTFPKQTGVQTLHWTGEAPVSGVTESNIALSTVTLTPKTAMAKGSLSRNLIVQGIPSAEQLVRNDLAAIAALGIDRAALHGAGASNEPDGLYHLSGVNSVPMGGAPTFGKLVDMTTAPAMYNALMGNLGFVTTPGMAGKLRQTLVASAAGSKMIWEGGNEDGQVAGYKALASNQVSAILGNSNNEHGILFGNWSEMIIGQWGGVEITVDPYTLADQGLVRLVLFLMTDVIVRHPFSFTKATGATL